MGLSDIYFSIDPLIRGAILAVVAFLGVEMAKPGFAFHEDEGSFYPKPFGANGFTETEDGAVIPSTLLPWWSIPVGAFLLCGLFI